MEALRIAAFERALIDERWDWIGAHLSEVTDETLRGRIVKQCVEDAV